LSLFSELKRRNVIRVAIAYVVLAWLMAQVAELLLEAFGAPDWVLKTVLGLFLLGFPFALFFAWAFELTPEGLKRESEVAAGQSITRNSGRKLDRAIIVILAIAVIYFAWDNFSPSPTGEPAGAIPERKAGTASTPADNSIAVLPFANLSSDPEQEYFSDGMTEEIISKLARIEQLPVASRTSVLRFKDTELDVREIAEALGVRYILEGSVRKAGEQLRITAQLIDSDNGFHVWSEDFSGSIADVFDVQERTALQIAEALDIHLSPQQRAVVQERYTENTEAFEAYLRGQELIRRWNDQGSLESAREQFEHALELEPEYAPAMAGLASMEAQTYRNFDPDETRLLRGLEWASRALELAPNLVRAHIAMGELAAIRYDYRGAARKFREATELEPGNALAWDLLSWALAYQQPPDGEGAVVAARKAIELSPDYANAFYHLGRALLVTRDYEGAIAAFKRVGESGVHTQLTSLGLSQAYLETGDLALAREHSDIAMDDLSAITLTYRSMIEAADGNPDAALEYLEQALEVNYRDFAALEVSPHLATLRKDPRYAELIARYR